MWRLCGAAGMMLAWGACCWAAQEGGADEHEGKSFSHSVQRIIVASREQFRPVESVRITNYPGGSYWYETKVMLPDAAFCRLYDHPRRLMCEWNKESRKKDRMTFAQLTEKVAAVLDERWERVNRAGKRREVEFRPKTPTREGVVEVTSTDDQDTRVRVVFYPAEKDY